MEIKEYNSGASFWELFPDLKKHGKFKELYKKDKQQGKSASSRMMWAFAAYVDNSKCNTLRNLPNEEKEEVINEDYLAQGVKLEPDKHSEEIEEMSKLLMPKKKGVLHKYMIKLDERAKLIEDSKYTLENASVLDKLIENTDKLFKAISSIELAIESGNDDGTVKGGRQQSLSELGKL